MAFKLIEQKPFEIEGLKGKYEIPSYYTMSYAEVEPVATMDTIEASERVERVKAFFLSLCPKLADEKLGDMAYMNLWHNYTQSLKLGEF